MSPRLLLFAVAIAGGVLGAGAQRVGDVERTILRRVEANNAGAVRLLERVVDINSGTMNFDGVRQVGQVFRSELDALGFTTTWIDGAPWQRAGHLVADHPGPGPRVLLIGHLDTVFERASTFQGFERIDRFTARGPGVIDMKGGDVIIVSALKALHEAGVLSGLNVVVVMTGDEEAAGRPLGAARDALLAAAAGADVAIGFEDGPGDPRYAVTARRSSTRWHLTVKGTPSHSSQIFRPDVGYGAIFEAARILNAFRERLAGRPHLTFNPGAMVGGTTTDLDPVGGVGTVAGKANIVAEEARATGDLRGLTAEQVGEARAEMESIVKGSLSRTSATLTFEDGYPPMAPSDGNARLLALYSQVSVDLGAGPVTAVDPDRAGAADVSFVAARVKMALDGIGLMGRGSHTANETADLTTLPSQTRRAALLLYRLSQNRAP